MPRLHRASLLLAPARWPARPRPRAQSDPVRRLARRLPARRSRPTRRTTSRPSSRMPGEAEQLRPDHGGVIYALASAYALTGDTAAAIADPARFAALGYFADLAADSDFDAPPALPGFAGVRRRLEAQRGAARPSRAGLHAARARPAHRGHRVRSRRPGRSSSAACISGRSCGWTSRGRVTEFVAAGRGRTVGAARHAGGSGAAGALGGGRGRAADDRLRLGRRRAQRPVPIRSRHRRSSPAASRIPDDGAAARCSATSRRPQRRRLRERQPRADRLTASARGRFARAVRRSPLLLSAQGLALTPTSARCTSPTTRAASSGSTSPPERSRLLPAAGRRARARHRRALSACGDASIGIQNGIEPHRVVRLRARRRRRQRGSASRCSSGPPGLRRTDARRRGGTRPVLHRQQSVGAIRRRRRAIEAPGRSSRPPLVLRLRL